MGISSSVALIAMTLAVANEEYVSFTIPPERGNGPGEECLRHRRGHLLVKVGGQCWMMSSVLEIDISVHAFSQKQQKIMSKIY